MIWRTVRRCQPKLYKHIQNLLQLCDDRVELPNNKFTFVIICIFTVVFILIGVNWAVGFATTNKLFQFAIKIKLAL